MVVRKHDRKFECRTSRLFFYHTTAVDHVTEYLWWHHCYFSRYRCYHQGNQSCESPDDKQNERLNAHDTELEKINRKLGADKDRLDLFQSKLVSLEEHQKENSITLEVHDRKILESEQRISHSEQGNNVTMKALLALLSHGIDGNAIEPMKEAKAALENYLIDGQNNTKNITN